MNEYEVEQLVNRYEDELSDCKYELSNAIEIIKNKDKEIEELKSLCRSLDNSRKRR